MGPAAVMNETEVTTCCIVGGGPAGMMLALLLAREGIRVTVLEKHADFLRDFRGDTIHASTLDLIDELGLRGELERIPHQAITRVRADVEGRILTVADFSTLRGPNRFLYLMPQWDFLELLARTASKSPSFRIVMRAEVEDVLVERGRVVGVAYREGERTRIVRAVLTVACDGRRSTLRRLLGARPIDLGAPMDVLWFRVPRKDTDPAEGLGIVRRGRMLVMIDRGGYWQCGYLVKKGDDERIRREGLAVFRRTIAELAPFLDEARLEHVATWEDVKMLRVEVNHLARWFRPGVLFLGDAAHAMSPIGGVGINLAIQDAVAAAQTLTEPLRSGRVMALDLTRIQLRRAPPAAVTQLAQVVVQRRFIGRVLDRRSVRAPWLVRRLLRTRFVRAAIARAIGVGFRPERLADARAAEPS